VVERFKPLTASVVVELCTIIIKVLNE